MQAENTITVEFQSSINFAVHRNWITKNQAELIRMADTIETIAYQIVQLESFMDKSDAYNSCLNYWMTTVFRASTKELKDMIFVEVDKILQERQ